MSQVRLPNGCRAALGLAAVLVLAGCATPDPHPASPSTPGDPDHPPSASLHGLEPSAPVPSDVINRPATSDINPYVPTNEPSQ
jgi:hypothetical protein